jgi:hypothetical protein
MPPEGLKHPQKMPENTQVSDRLVAEWAALPDQSSRVGPAAPSNDEVRAGAINAWIDRCPVALPEAIIIGIRAMVVAAGSDPQQPAERRHIGD